MEPVTLDAFEREAAAYDAVVAASPGVDRFCTSAPWILAARDAWGHEGEPWLRRSAAGYAIFLRRLLTFSLSTAIASLPVDG